uniref:Uncharacterized protein n=1 Tax=Heterorhabditis bacteriophora TaxID=37862 RepID=A0A1I7WZF6_HETBA
MPLIMWHICREQMTNKDVDIIFKMNGKTKKIKFHPILVFYFESPRISVTSLAKMEILDSLKFV